MIALGQQGNRTQWDGILKRKVCWLDICGFNFIHIRFLIQAVYDTILKPANVQTWGKAETPQYLLYEKRWLLKNILRCCTKAFGDGCYSWRHNQVLRVIANVFNKCLWTSIYKPVSRRINFLRSATSEKTSLLCTRRDWKAFVDLDEQLKFSDHIVRTQLQKDMILVSNTMKLVIMWELTVS